MKTLHAVALAVALSSPGAAACSTVIVPSYKLPQIAPGWQAQLVANGFKKPRQLKFDGEGALLVLDSGVGIKRLKLTDNGGTCLSVSDNQLIINRTTLNHGLAFSGDGKTLYASSVQSVFAWSYDSKSGAVGESPTIVVDNMSNNEHTTRTLLMSKKKPGMLVVSRGSDENFDIDALDVATGLSQIKVFDLNKLTSGSQPYNFNSDGRRLGWGLRNSVGVAEEPTTGNVYSVENSIDDITRGGVDIHENNPGEELNFHGKVDDTNDGQNYGYPRCYALWDKNIPDLGSLKIGNQFSLKDNASVTDEACDKDYVEPRITFPPHTAPLDILFSEDGSKAYVAFHGSFNREAPIGYTISALDFADGQPVAPADSTTALTDIMTNPDVNECPEKCFRPAGLVWDSKGRLWMASDTTGELYVLEKQAGTPTSTSSGTIVTATGEPNAGSTVWNVQTLALTWAAVLVAGLMAF